MNNEPITWTCEHCGRSIQDRTGVLTINVNAAMNQRRAQADWRTNQGDTITAIDLLDFPEPIHWFCLHFDCNADWTDDDFQIGVEECRTYRGLLLWTVHLAKKNWFSATDWLDICDEYLKESVLS